jgi:hypothetical protein
MISWADTTKYMENVIIKNKDMGFIFGNVFLVSLLITIILILIFTLNSDNLVSTFIYSFLAVIIIVLIENKIIKNHYKNKSSNNTIFDKMEVKTGSADTITPRKFLNSGSNIIQKSNDINNTDKIDDNNDINGENEINRLMARIG